MSFEQGSFFYRRLYRRRIYHFPVRVNCPYDFDMSRIHPFKQPYVLRMLQETDDMPWIKELWIFGSSVGPLCRYESDIDIAISYDEEIFEKSHTLSLAGNLTCTDPEGVDILYLNKLNKEEPIYREIMKGVCYGPNRKG